jgi:DNA polymerase I-like protein with 3'-5' exonuclease and polymerase domains
LSKVYITNPDDLLLVIDKEIRPYWESQEAPHFGLDFETSTLLDHRNEELYKVPQPIALPPRFVSSLLTRQSFLMEREGFSATMQLGADPKIYDRQWIIDAKKISREFIGHVLKPILEKSFILGHSLRYECGFLEEEYDIFLPPERIRDVRILDQLLIAGSACKTGLMSGYRRYIDYGIFIAETQRKNKDGTTTPGMDFNTYEDWKKGMQESEWGGEITEEQLWYGADDVRLPFFMYETQKELLRKHCRKHLKSNLLSRFKLECGIVPECSRMYVRGVNFDEEYHNRHVIPYLEKKKEEEYAKALAVCPNPNPMKEVGRGRGKARVFTLEQEPINLRSPAQIMGCLKLLDIKIPNTTEQTLKEHRFDHPAIEHILRYKKAANMLSKYGYMLPKFVHQDGKIHADFGQLGTETGRFAYWAPGLQTIPAKETLFGETKASELFREAFTADDDCEIIDGDLPNIEPKLISQSTQEPGLINAFRTKTDYHGFTAKILMDLDYFPLKGSWHREKIGKIGNLSLGYGASFRTLKDNMLKYTLDDPEPIRWTDDYAKEKHEAYFTALPLVKAKIDEIKQRVEDALDGHDTLADFAGRKPIFEIFSEWPATPKRSHMCYRAFYLFDWQEEMARNKHVGNPKLHPLHKWYQVIEKVLDEEGREVLDPETGEPKMKKHYYNAYKRMMNDIAREAYNFMIQAEGAAILKCIIRDLSRKLREAGFTKREGLLLTVHDELVLHVHKSRVELATRLLTETMEECCREVIIDVPVSCEAKAGRSWAAAM